MQFGAEPLFENISAKFGNGNRYGLIGANGCGKSTFMKIDQSHFVGLALDEDSQYELSDERIETWCEQILVEYHNSL